MKTVNTYKTFQKENNKGQTKRPLPFGEGIKVRGFMFFFLFLLVSVSAFAQNPMVKAQIETSQIRIGEQFSFRISVNETENVILPKLELKGLEVIDSARVDTLNNMLIQKYIITGFDSGAYYIPQQQIYVKNQAYLTDSLLVNVATVAIDTTKIKKTITTSRIRVTFDHRADPSNIGAGSETNTKNRMNSPWQYATGPYNNESDSRNVRPRGGSE